MDEREELIRELDKSRGILLELLADIPPDIEIYPGWTLRQFYAHLTGWDDATTSSLRAHASGQDQVTPAADGIDFYNAHSVSTREELDYDHTCREWDLARTELKDAVRAMPPEKFEEKLIYPWGGVGTVSKLIEVIYEHEAEHAAEIEKLIEKFHESLKAD